MTPEQQHAKEYQADQKAYEARYRPVILRALKAQLKPLFDQLEAGITPNPDISIQGGYFTQAIFQLYESIGLTAARREYSWMKKMAGQEEKASFLQLMTDKWRAFFRQYVSDYAYRIDNELTETTRQLVRDELQKAYDEGLNADKLITRIKRGLGVKSRQRATTIARTETTTAANIAKEQGAKAWAEEVGDKLYKGWVARLDERTRRAHVIENDTYIPVDENFILEDPKAGRIECERPGDLVLPASQRCNCRCVCVYISERRYLRMVERGEVK